MFNTITIIIPTLNEEKGIEETIKSIPLGKLRDNYKVDLIVIDGNSKDNTVKIAKENGAIVIVENNRGYGRAYKTGFAQAKGEVIVTMDADSTYPAEKIPEYLLLLEKNNLDFLTVNRFDSMEKDSMNVLHKLGNHLLSGILRLIYSIDIKDSQSGMWIMKKSFVDRLSLQSDGMAFSQDIKIVAFKYFKSMEVRGTYFKRLGKAKMSLINDGFSNLKNLFVFRSQLPHCIKELSAIPLPAVRNS